MSPFTYTLATDSCHMAGVTNVCGGAAGYGGTGRSWFWTAWMSWRLGDSTPPALSELVCADTDGGDGWGIWGAPKDVFH